MTGTFTYDLSSSDSATLAIANLRLLISDKEQNEASFSDEELTAFYTMAGGTLREAAAIAYTAWVGSEAKIARMLEQNEVQSERDAVDKLLEVAAAFRKADIANVGATRRRRIVHGKVDQDAGFYTNIRPLGNKNQDALKEYPS